ncbi:MAG: hypothetical protein KF857_06260 [Fimbriimonadaceae bacterium]|nr:hypothetical protein [Fimbriimonadaceae bacterium]
MVQAAVSALPGRAGLRMLVAGQGGLLAAADLNGGLRLYADRQEVWCREDLDRDGKTSQAARVTDMEFDLDGRLLVVVGSHGVMCVDTSNGATRWRQRRRWEFGLLADLPLTVCIGADGDFVVSFASGRVERLTMLGRKKRHWHDHSAPQSMSFDLESKTLFGADGQGVRSWDASVWPPVERAALVGRWVKVVAVPKRPFFVARRLDATVALDTKSLDVLWSVPGPVAHPAMAVTPSGDFVAWIDSDAVVVHNATDGRLVERRVTRHRPLCVVADDAGFVAGLADGTLEEWAPPGDGGA